MVRQRINKGEMPYMNDTFILLSLRSDIIDKYILKSLRKERN